MKKVTVTIFFTVDETNNTTRRLHKLKVGIRVEIPHAETKYVYLSVNNTLMLLIKNMLNRWDNVSDTLSMTTTQWNEFKTILKNAIGGAK